MKHYRGYQRASFIDYADTTNVFFVTICVSPRRPAFVDKTTNVRLIELMKALQDEGCWGIYLYCIMPDHIHLVLNAGRDGLPSAVRLLKGRYTPWWRKRGDGQTLWQNGFHDHRLRSGESFTDKCRYVAENPVRAGLVDRSEDYQWTGSLATLTGSF